MYTKSMILAIAFSVASFLPAADASLPVAGAPLPAASAGLSAMQLLDKLYTKKEGWHRYAVNVQGRFTDPDLIEGSELIPAVHGMYGRVDTVTNHLQVPIRFPNSSIYVTSRKQDLEVVKSCGITFPKLGYIPFWKKRLHAKNDIIRSEENQYTCSFFKEGDLIRYLGLTQAGKIALGTAAAAVVSFGGYKLYGAYKRRKQQNQLINLVKPTSIDTSSSVQIPISTTPAPAQPVPVVVTETESTVVSPVAEVVESAPVQTEASSVFVEPTILVQQAQTTGFGVKPAIPIVEKLSTDQHKTRSVLLPLSDEVPSVPFKACTRISQS